MQFEAVQLNFEEDVKSLMLLSSLPESWETVITTISNGTQAKLKFKDVTSQLLDYERRRKSMVNTAGTWSKSVLTVDKNKHERGRRGRSVSRRKSDRAVRCLICSKEGHVKRDCPDKFKNNANVIHQDEEELCLSVHDKYNSDIWYVDSGFSFHCTSHKEWSCGFVDRNFGHVVVGNGQKCMIKGKGFITLKEQDSGGLVFHEVRYIPDLKKNLISVSKLDQEGYRIIFEKGQWKICSDSSVLIKGKQ